MSSILAALGIEQLKVLDEMVSRRRYLAYRYIKKLKDNKNIGLVVETKEGYHSYQTFCIYVDNRDDIIYYLKSKGIEANIGTYSLHAEPYFQKSQSVRLLEAYPGSKFLKDKALSLPLYYEMDERTQDIVINSLLSIL
jgi:dTDP-4-amino-4,6-dideoxygalactose transaminase